MEKKTRKFLADKTTSLRKGLKQLHIGEDVWLFGKQTCVKDKGLHMVIYGPGRKEYHVWNEHVENTVIDKDVPGVFNETNVNRHGNKAAQENVKIYILTSILDNRDNWCFDLSNIPENNDNLKIIYENGTVKNVKFDGVFREAELVSKRFTWKANVYRFAHTDMKFVKPIAYRKY